MNLPPLPPVGGETTGRNVVDVVTGEHRRLLKLCDRLAADPADKRLASALVAELSRHLSAEEQYLYPAVRRTVPGGDELADRELAEDRQLLISLQQLQKQLSAERVAEVAASVRRHVDADAEELLPVLVQMVPIEDLIRVGNRFETAEEAAPTRPHPGTPSTPPWNKVVDPAVAVVDKLRDAVTGRTTYAKDL
ncbi:hemerythrin domain-containing protein [Actinoplanes bogorensis]|uniref:Hemerythrin domain-containing protein n=1 Tax=Paractinoplanes bogorensis TaxID=1610840 RepID=A0ABS5YLS8_9ACTN|nr:hemerythrin domain-containing protein [Actinoplanes bogorensis]MBU2664420.1 hemerythrin domain-containing protein [Actinoplanes bogorensis]